MCQNCCSDPELPLLIHQTTNRACRNRHPNPVCYHYEQRSQPACFELDTCNTLVYCNYNESRIEILLRQLLSSCIEDAFSCCDSLCCHTSSRCTLCATEHHNVVSELTDLLERLSDGGIRCSCNSHHCRIPRCSSHSTQIESQALIDIFSRIIKRGHISRSTSRQRVRFSDTSSKILIAQILDELECNGRAVCECQTCCEYIEINSRRLKRELKQDGECRQRNRECCGGAGACYETLTKTTVRAPTQRRQRNGNIHVGWSL